MISLKHSSFLVKEIEDLVLGKIWLYTIVHRQTNETFEVEINFNDSIITIGRNQHQWNEEKFSLRCYRYYIWLSLKNAIKECIENHPDYRLPLLTGTRSIHFTWDLAEHTVPETPPRSFWAFFKLGYSNLEKPHNWMIMMPGFVSLITLVWHPPYDTLVFLCMILLQGTGVGWVGWELYRYWRKLKKHTPLPAEGVSHEH